MSKVSRKPGPLRSIGFKVVIGPVTFSCPTHPAGNGPALDLPEDQPFAADRTPGHQDNVAGIDLVKDFAAGVRSISDPVGWIVRSTSDDCVDIQM